jgi:hypothetical protein
MAALLPVCFGQAGPTVAPQGLSVLVRGAGDTDLIVW